MDDADVPSDGESDATPPPYPDHGEYPSEEELEDGSVLNQGAFVGPGATSGGESEVTPPTTPENDEDLSDEEAEEGSAVSQDGHTTPSGAIDFPDLQQQGDSPHSEPIPRSPLNALSDPDSGSDSDSAEGDQSADERGYRTDVSMNDEECWPEWYGVGSEAQNEECWPEWYGVGGEAQNEEETLDGTGHMSVDPSSDEDETQRRGPVQASRTKAKTGLAPRGHVGRNVLRKQANKRQRESSRERSTTSDNKGVIRSPERKKGRMKEITTEEESEVKLVDKERMLFLAKKLSNFDPLTVKEKKQLAKAITVYTSRKESGVPKIDAALLQADVLRDRYAKMTFKVPIEGGFKSTPGGIVEIRK
jgi:hypothetical protein